jgi:hypothetical protein
VEGPTYTVTATGGGSKNPVTFEIDSTTASVCSLSGPSTVSFLSAGTCKVNAKQAPEGAFTEGTAQQPIEVRKAQTINFTSPAPESATVGGPTYQVTATGGGSGKAVTFTIDPTSSSVCTISEATVSFTGAGTCTVDANQAGDSEYAAAPAAQLSFPVSRKPQEIKFTSAPPSPALVGATYHPTATGGGPVKFAINGSAGSVCTISESGIVSFIGVGTCVIDATQEGNTEYLPAAPVQQSFQVARPTVITVVPGPKPSPAPTPPPGAKPVAGTSAFTAGASSFMPTTGMVVLVETIINPGSFKWLLTVPNGKFGVFVSSRTCKAGFVRLRGRCGPPKIVFSTGSAAVPAGVVIFKLRPTASALKVLTNAAKRNKGVRVTATFTFQSSRGGAPVSHTQSLVVKLKKK